MTITNKIGGKVAVLGAGNIGLAIAKGIVSNNDFRMTGESVIITRRSRQFTPEEEEQFDCFSSNQKAVSEAEIVIIAPQPGDADDLLNEIAEVLEDQLLISVVSGLSIKRIEELTGHGPIVRAMPNTAIEVRESTTALAFNEEGSKHRDCVLAIFNTLGKTRVIDEEKFTEATVFYASALAFAMYFIQVQANSCMHLQFGTSEEDARRIAIQVMKGAAMLLENNPGDLEARIKQVSTPGGCTVEMLARLREEGFGATVLSANAACLNKAEQLYSKK